MGWNGTSKSEGRYDPKKIGKHCIILWVAILLAFYCCICVVVLQCGDIMLYSIVTAIFFYSTVGAMLLHSIVTTI